MVIDGADIVAESTGAAANSALLGSGEGGGEPGEG
jgi:hypothetical protein